MDESSINLSQQESRSSTEKKKKSSPHHWLLARMLHCGVFNILWFTINLLLQSIAAYPLHDSAFILQRKDKWRVNKSRNRDTHLSTTMHIHLSVHTGFCIDHMRITCNPDKKKYLAIVCHGLLAVITAAVGSCSSSRMLTSASLFNYKTFFFYYKVQNKNQNDMTVVKNNLIKNLRSKN